MREVRQGPVRAARRQVRERAVEDVDAHAHVERADRVEPIAGMKRASPARKTKLSGGAQPAYGGYCRTFSASDRNASISQHSVPLS